jgi:hypothetical protein
MVSRRKLFGSGEKAIDCAGMRGFSADIANPIGTTF